MKSVLLSIRPVWCEKIAGGEKTIEVRKTRPKLETPFKCYIYCTMGDKLWVTTERFRVICNGKSASIINAKDVGGCYLGNGKVIGEFVCDGVYENMSYDCEQSCVSASELREYANGKALYGWHISDLKIYNKPKELSEFHHCGENYHFNPVVTKPPQSWCYVEEL